MRNYIIRNNQNIFDAMNAFLSSATYPDTTPLKADIRETADGYIFELNVAGFKKEDINVTLEDGYLAVKCEKKDTLAENEKYLRRELSALATRSFYVGKYLTADLIKAKYENGILSLYAPKNAPKQEQNISITVE